MLNFDINEYKIPVVSGINDSPIPPNFGGNGKGCNGSFYVERLNKLADLLITYRELPTIENFTINNTKSIEVEIGYSISVPLVFNYEIVSPVETFQVESDLYYGLDKVNINLTAQNISTNHSHIPVYSRYTEETTLYWVIRSLVDDIFTIQSEFLTTSWKKPYIVGGSVNTYISNNLDASFSQIDKKLDKDGSFEIGDLQTLKYIYLFSPIEITGIKIVGSNMEIPLVKYTNTVVYTGLPTSSYPGYFLYRTTEKTVGNFSFEIIP